MSDFEGVGGGKEIIWLSNHLVIWMWSEKWSYQACEVGSESDCVNPINATVEEAQHLSDEDRKKEKH